MVPSSFGVVPPTGGSPSLQNLKLYPGCGCWIAQLDLSVAGMSALAVGTAVDVTIKCDEAMRLEARAVVAKMHEAKILPGTKSWSEEERRAAYHRHVRRFGGSGVTSLAVGDLGELLFGLRTDGEEFPIEASISKSEVAGHTTEALMANDELAQQTMRLNQTLASLLVSNAQPMEQRLGEINVQVVGWIKQFKRSLDALKAQQDESLSLKASTQTVAQLKR